MFYKINNYFFLVFLIACIIAISLYLYGTQCGLGITYDSEDYLYSAQTWAKQRQLLRKNGQLHTERTPLMAFLLAIYPTQMLVWARVLHFVSWVIILGSVYYIARELGLSLTIIAWLCLQISVAMPMHLVHHFLWSEAIFMLFFSLIVLNTYLYLQKKQYIYLIVVVLLANLLSLQRNVGIIFMIWLVFSLWWRDKNWLNAYRYAWVFILSCLGWGIFSFWAKWIAGGRLNDNLQQLGHNIFSKHNIDHYLNAITAWFFPMQIPLILRVFILMLVVFMYFLWYKTHHKNIQKPTPKPLLSVIAFTHIGYILTMQFIERVDFHEVERYVAICFPWIMLYIAYLTYIYEKTIKSKFFYYIWVMFLSITLIYPLHRSSKNLTFFKERNCQKRFIE